ncbi:methyltransferase domain-containing protein [Dissulfurirhabdus thermomarina]|uniref:Methyltransferase domain-containing protein n=1 Tax=Dissulfurirhabdus thermomarina TaxID=1765737 RepID=A0A6N9TU51_DISTH|nr:class I SAM-dependent methyltransferase [Dissulfurirhabdus thermomarina]NDY43264.1 methyltransferase domain-containing protein [Dissulfurirhabdus thermomarina]NMX23782.1 methyltransferase domain-containing protein [Dissulfurirhabdus thermomarina]
MERVPEPELMAGEDQARAYAEADFEEPHRRVLEVFHGCFPGLSVRGPVLDLGCGPGDITRRFAEAFPGCEVHGVDGSPAMLRQARRLLAVSPARHRVRLVLGVLPDAPLARSAYDLVVSNSLLHHLADPGVLWRAARAFGRPGAAVFVMDLRRPDSPAEAAALVDRYAGGEPEILRRDFFRSLLAAYRPGEVRRQLEAAGLHHFEVQAVGDRHLAAWGRLLPGG